MNYLNQRGEFASWKSPRVSKSRSQIIWVCLAIAAIFAICILAFGQSTATIRSVRVSFDNGVTWTDVSEDSYLMGVFKGWAADGTITPPKK